MFEILKELCKIGGISGCENSVRNYIIDKIKANADITVDPLGNIIAFVKGKNRANKKIMIDAHMDEVGLIITAVTSDGMLKFSAVGGIDTSVLLCRRVVSKNGVKGVISSKPVHMLSGDEKSKMPEKDSLYIDVGAKDKESALALVSLGDVMAFDVEFEALGDLIVSKALDDRIGCAVLIDMINSSPEYDFYATFTVQEEVGLRGAKTATFTVSPDFAIALEATTAADVAGVAEDKRVCAIGDGVAVSFMDNATMYDRELFEEALKIAKENEIKCQVKSAVAGGNNAGAIHLSRGGVRTIALSVPCRYIHSPSSVASGEDVKSLRALAEKMFIRMASGDIK